MTNFYRIFFFKVKSLFQVLILYCILEILTLLPGLANFGGDETRSGYVRSVQGVQLNVPAHHGLYNSMVRAHTSK